MPFTTHDPAQPFHPRHYMRSLTDNGWQLPVAQAWCLLLSTKESLVYSAIHTEDTERAGKNAQQAALLAAELAWHARNVVERLSAELDADSAMRVKMDVEAAFAPRGAEGPRIVS